jgi:ABC-2 type transport system permease protein
MVRVLRMEWTKLRTVPSTVWSLFALVALTVAVGALVLWSLGATHCGARCDQDLPKLSLSGVYLGQLAVVAVAVLAMTAEYDTMMIRTTLAAAPRRLAVLAAKAVVVTGTVLGVGLLTVLGSLVAGRSLPVRGYPALSLLDEPTRRAYLGTVLYLGLVALLSLGIGALVRDTAGAITIVLALLYVAPIVAEFVSNARWHDRIYRYAPMTAGLAVQATRHLNTLPIQPWHGLGVLAGYAGGALLLGAVAFKLQDA